MQIADEHGWLQVVFGIISTVLGAAWVYLQRQISRLRGGLDKHAEQINENTRAIAVNSAIREENIKRHGEMMTRFDRLEQTIRDGFEKSDADLKAGLEKMDDKLEAAKDVLHTRINDVKDMRYAKGSGG